MSPTTLAEPLSFPPHTEDTSVAQPAPKVRAASDDAKDTTLTRLPSLDGWRAVSIILVLGSHTALTAGFPAHLEKPFHHLFDGHLGVRFFFVVSGLLITWLMLGEERKTQQVNLKNFYARRALRILPVYVAFLVVAAFIQYFTISDHSVEAWIANLTFTRNFIRGNGISGHFWSLAVEEQFYLLWPFVFVWLAPATRMRIMPYIVGGTVIVAFITRYLWAFPISKAAPWANLFQERSFFNNADSLAIGCMAALWLSSDERRLRSLVTSRRYLVVGLSLLMLIEPYAMHWLTDRAWMPAALKGAGWAAWMGLGRTIQSVGFTLLLLQSIMLPSWGLYRCLNWRPVAALGVLSYSIYVWQNIFCEHPADFGMPVVWWMSYPLWLVPVFAAALISYHCLEKPFLALRKHFR